MVGGYGKLVSLQEVIGPRKIGLIPLLLKEGAKQWFQALNGDAKTTFQQVKEAFMEQYERDETYKWKDSAAVWATTQGESQTVENYFTDVLKKAQRAGLSEEQTRYSLINGLRKNIRQAVLQHEPEGVQKIKKWALVAESAGNDGETSDVLGIIRRMEKKLESMTVQEMGGANGRRSGSPRVTFDTRRERSESPRRRAYDSQEPTYSWNRGREEERYQPEYRNK